MASHRNHAMINKNTIFHHFRRVLNQSITLIGLSVLLLAGYASNGYGANTILAQEQANTELDLFDSIAFDFKLSRSLSAKQPVVTVKSIAPFTVNDIPERIDKWLYAVSNNDGIVDLKPDPDYPLNRDFGSGIIFELLNKVFDLTKEMLMFRYAKNYNVDILYKPGSGEVTKFVFTLKEDLE